MLDVDRANEGECDADDIEAMRAASPVLRALTEECLRIVAAEMRNASFAPGEEIMREGGVNDDCLCFLTYGEAKTEGSIATELRSGAVFGNSRFLSLPGCNTNVLHVVAVTACFTRVLKREHLELALQRCPNDAKSCARLQEQASAIIKHGKGLQRKLHHGAIFRSCSHAFVAFLFEHLEEAFFAPGEEIFRRGEECIEGATPIYVVLAGEVLVLGEDNVQVRTLRPGDVFGMAEAAGAVSSHATACKASHHGLVYCARLPGFPFDAACLEHPDEKGLIQELACRLAKSDDEALKNRYAWIDDVAVPSLARSPLFCGCPNDFLKAVAAPLAHSSVFACGDTVTSVGDSASSMLVVLEGTLELESKAGMKVGQLCQGGVLGEVEVLGVFGTRMVTARALTACRVLVVTAEALQNALAGPHAGPIKDGFKRLVASRRDQVVSGMPLRALPIGKVADDVASRTVSLHAERLHFGAGEMWEPIPDSDPCGPRIAVFVKGHATLEITSDNSEVMQLQPGSLVVEGAAAESGARIRVLSGDCEVYRIRVQELSAAARIAHEAPMWFHQLRLLEREARAHLRTRLTNAQGLASIRAPHPTDNGIRDWSERRQRSMKRAQKLRKEKAHNMGGTRPSLQLPLLPCAKMGTTAYRSWDIGPMKPAPPPPGLGPGPGPGFPRGLCAYSALRLPRVQSDSQLHRIRSTDQALVAI